MKHKTVLLLSALLCGFVGSAIAEPADNRTVISLSRAHRTIVLEEMRGFLTGLQQITDAIAREDMNAVADAASRLGLAMSHQIPADLKQALPLGFRQQGHAVHSAFDTIALDAQSMEDPGHSLTQLSDTLKKCVACHATYQIQQIAD